MYDSDNKQESSSQEPNGKRSPPGMMRKMRKNRGSLCTQQASPFIMSVVFMVRDIRL